MFKKLDKQDEFFKMRVGAYLKKSEEIETKLKKFIENKSNINPQILDFINDVHTENSLLSQIILDIYNDKIDEVLDSELENRVIHISDIPNIQERIRSLYDDGDLDGLYEYFAKIRFFNGIIHQRWFVSGGKNKGEKYEEYEKAHNLKKTTERLIIETLINKGYIKKSTINEYETWLSGYLTSKNFNETYLHAYKYPFHKAERWYTIMKSCNIPILHGAAAISLIVMNGVTPNFPFGIGHNKLFEMDGFKTASTFIPIYEDMNL